MIRNVRMNSLLIKRGLSLSIMATLFACAYFASTGEPVWAETVLKAWFGGFFALGVVTLPISIAGAVRMDRVTQQLSPFAAKLRSPSPDLFPLWVTLSSSLLLAGAGFAAGLESWATAYALGIVLLFGSRFLLVRAIERRNRVIEERDRSNPEGRMSVTSMRVRHAETLDGCAHTGNGRPA